MKDFIICSATLPEMAYLLSMAKAEGWNPGLHDADAFYHTDPNGFFIGKLDGKMVGCISAVAYDSNYGFAGFYIIHPEYRGMGYGIKLWNHGIAYLGNRTIGLDGVVAQQHNYKKSGFKLAYNNIRFGGKVNGRSSKELHPISSIPLQQLVHYDTSIFGVDRLRFLQQWIKMSNASGFAKLADGKLIGYGMIRQCGVGYKIGPLFADSLPTAREIFLALAEKSGGSEIFLDVVQTNREALSIVQEHNLNKVFETARMYRGDPPNQQLPKIFGITTFELG